MIVVPRWWGRFGNQLWQYAVGRCFAEQLGTPFVCKPTTFSFGFGDTEVCPWWTPASIETGRPHNGNPITYTDEDMPYPLPRERRKVILDGYFQRWPYIWDHVGAIRRWFKLPANHREPADTLTVSVRLADAKGLFQTWVPPEWLAAEAARFDHCRRVVVVTDEPRPKFLKPLRRQFGKRMVIHKHEPTTDFLTLAAASNLVAPMLSTFPWWAAVLGEVPRAVFVGPTYDTQYHENRDVRIPLDGFEYVTREL